MCTFVCLRGSDPCCLVCFSIKRAVKEREQMAAGPLCPASSHNCHTSCASINLLSLLLQHNFIKTTQERANQRARAAVRSKRQNHSFTEEQSTVWRHICAAARMWSEPSLRYRLDKSWSLRTWIHTCSL